MDILEGPLVCLSHLVSRLIFAVQLLVGWLAGWMVGCVLRDPPLRSSPKIQIIKFLKRREKKSEQSLRGRRGH